MAEAPTIRQDRFKETYTDKDKDRYININASSKDTLYKKVAGKFNTTKANAKRVLDKQLIKLEQEFKMGIPKRVPVSTMIELNFSPYGKGGKELISSCIAYTSSPRGSWELKCSPIRKN
tara:strand:- start:764 stop:1120 length:357 start_codon:yes stop_codon:yes gene_type:complete